MSTPIASEVAAARLIRTNSPDNDDGSIVGMWKTSLKRTRHKSSYPFSIWESNCWVQLRFTCVLPQLVEDAVPEGCFVITITAIVSGWEFFAVSCQRTCDLANMQVHF